MSFVPPTVASVGGSLAFHTLIPRFVLLHCLLETVHQGEIAQAAALEPVLKTEPTQATILPLVDDMTETSKESTHVGDSAMAPEMTQAN